ncbi:sphingosine kinase 2-like isoform X2 [Narcine bancroftii]|uniref:sphingosine kinase 2-like isoform X2 n=1 Tax=Narcine bancroftii TaxID=1343680 RepID=UPI0038321E84
MVKRFLVDGAKSGQENRAQAERWAVAIKCLLLGVRLPEEAAEITVSLLPPSRRLLLLVNPCSGRSQAMALCREHVLPAMSEANISYNLVCTERQNHARDLVQEIELSEWDGIVIVSGDGLMHEVINGLMSRPDWESAIKMPLGIIPAGSGNALAAAINYNAGLPPAVGSDLLLNCLLLLCRGTPSPLDLVSVTTASGRRLFSFLSVALGFVADVDIESERYRALGPTRFTLGTLLRLASLRRYPARLSYLPAPSPHLRPHRSLCRSATASTPGPLHQPLGRTLSDIGPWGVPSTPPHSPSRLEGYSFEGMSFQEEEEEEGDGGRGVGAEGKGLGGLGEGGQGSRAGPEGGGVTRENPGVSAEGPEAKEEPRESRGHWRRVRDGPGVFKEGPEVREGSGESPELSPGSGEGPGEEDRVLGRCDGDNPGVEGLGRPNGSVPAKQPLALPPDHLLPPLHQPLPPGWETVQEDFVLVLAMYQSHLGADLLAAPFARLSERALHLCYVTAGISRTALLRIFLAMETGAHFSLACPHLVCVPASAFRLEPLGPRRGLITVDGEQVEFGPLQAQLHRGLGRVIAGVPWTGVESNP